MARRKAPRIPDALLDQLLAGADPKTAFESNGLIDDLKKALAERALNAEMDHHLAGDDPSFPAPICATLVEVEGEEGLQLIWSRPNRD